MFPSNNDGGGPDGVLFVEEDDWVVTLLVLPLFPGTDVNAMDLRGVTPLHLAQSRLRVLGDSEGRGSPESIPLTRKKEITNVCSP